MRRADGHRQGVHARRGEIFVCLFGRRVEGIGKIFVRRGVPHMSDLSLHRRPEGMRDFYDFPRFRDICFALLCRAVVHDRRKAQLQRFHAPLKRQPVIVMHGDGDLGALCRLDDRRRDQLQSPIGQQYLRRADHNRRNQLLRRLYRRLKHVRVVGIEQPHRILFPLRPFQNPV